MIKIVYNIKKIKYLIVDAFIITMIILKQYYIVIISNTFFKLIMIIKFNKKWIN
jgi:hypothetical protein